MPELEKRKIIAIVLLVSVFVGASVLWQDSRQVPGKVMAEVPESAKTALERQKITVNITGAVVNAGVYSVMPVQRVSDIVELAGGFLSEADRDKVNLARRCSDGMKINVPYKKAPKSKTTRRAAQKAANNAVVNINTADEAELQRIPGVGPVLAKKIVDYRETHGPFKTTEQLRDVGGIGESKFETLKGNIKI